MANMAFVQQRLALKNLRAEGSRLPTVLGAVKSLEQAQRWGGGGERRGGEGGGQRGGEGGGEGRGGEGREEGRGGEGGGEQRFLLLTLLQWHIYLGPFCS